jgi:PAS domain S-box-containing protein
MSPYDITERRAGYFFILIFTLLAAGIIATGYFYYRHHEQYFRSDMENHLSSIAKLKVGELALWRRERLADGAILLKNAAFSALVRRFLEKPEDKDAQRLLWVWIGAYSKNYQYTGACLFDTQGVLRMLAPEDWDQIDSFSAGDILEIMRPGRVVFADFHRDSFDGNVHLSIVIPIFDGPDFSQPLGVIVFDIDPQTYLYPFISRWPTPTQTAETLLVRRDGDSALFLNELRFRKNTALNLRIPLNKTKVPAVMAALGYEGIAEGVDYRGEPVISVIKAVPDSPWYLVSKINKSEVYSPLRERLWLVVTAIGGQLLGAGAAVFIVWRQQSLRYYRKRYEATEALRESEEKFRALVEQIPGTTYIAVIDETSSTIYNSPQIESMLGFSADEFVADPALWMKQLHPEDRERVLALVAKSGATGSDFESEYRLMARDGRTVWIRDEARVVRDKQGQSLLHGVMFEITGRKLAEEALVRSERKYRSLFTNMRSGFAYCKMIFDENNKPVDWIYLEVNDAFERVIGLKREAVEGKRVTEVFPTIKDFRPNLFEIYGQVALAGVGTEFTINFDISAVWLSISVYCPQKGHFVAVFDDITDRKRAEDALQESEELHRVIMETANDAIICVDQNGKVRLWNRRAEEMFGYTAQEAQDKNIHDFITPEKYRKQTRAGFANFVATGEGSIINKTREITALRGDGSEFPIELSVAAVKMREGWGASAIIKDITARKERESKLTETNEKLKKAMDDIERTHSQLIRSEKLAALGQLSAGVAHELKNPLNIIYTSTQLMMMEEGLTDEVAESSKIIMEQVMRAVKIIDNLRDFARERKPERKEIDLRQFIGKTMGLVAYEMKGEGIEIAKEFPPEPIRIMGDVDQLAQVFLNITNNARDSMNMRRNSYSMEERERIGWRARLTVRTQVENGKTKISFEDNGIGIPEENREKLFTPFFSTKGETKGTGLGIAIALGIIENHGGTIEFESEEGKGATFTIVLPVSV